MPSSVSDAIAIVDAPELDVIPLRFRDRLLTTFDGSVSPAATKGLEAALAFAMARRDATSLVLIGPPGAGKTHLAAGVCNAMWSRSWIEAQRAVDAAERRFLQDPDGAAWPAPAVRPDWANVPRLINTLRGGDNDARRRARDLASTTALVVLDDLGREKVTEWTGETIYVLINERYEQRLPTIVTSNLTVKELAENGYGPAISRLSEGGRLIEMATASDYRTRR